MSSPLPPRGGLCVCRPAAISYASHSKQGITLMSDLHFGANNIDYQLIEHEVDEALKNGDRVLINGDLFDGIISRDPRFDPDVLHPRLRGKRDVLNRAVSWAVETFAPVANQLDVVGIGNHETANERWGGIDLNALFVHEIQRLTGKIHLVHRGGYGGFVDYRFRWTGSKGYKPKARDSYGRRLVIFYHHGSGKGGAPVTRGMLDLSRKSWVDADVIWLGHKHYRTTGAIQTVSCPMQGDNLLVKDVRHVMTGSYFDTYTGQSQESMRENGRLSNYAADAGLAPQGKGGARLEITFGNLGDGYQLKVVQ